MEPDPLERRDVTIFLDLRCVLTFHHKEALFSYFGRLSFFFSIMIKLQILSNRRPLHFFYKQHGPLVSRGFTGDMPGFQPV